MSVINKMLRDLDHRANPSARVQLGPAALRQGTASVPTETAAAPRASGPSAPRLWIGLGLLAGAATSAGGWWWWTSSTAEQPPIARSVATAPPVSLGPPPALAANAATSIALVASSPAESTGPPIAKASSTSGDVRYEPSLASMVLRMEPSLSARKALDALLAAPAAPAPPTAVQPATATAVAPGAVAAPPPARTATVTAKPTPTPTPTADSTPVLQRQQQAGGDALSQVQALWNSGSHDAAMELMQQSISATERSLKAGTAAGSSAVVLVPLVREMARMQLAEDRYGAVWEMLTRLEPLLGNQADLWAIRANTAQRLGRHTDSVHAYMMALQTRPDEQRWLLGTAVSLAALGQTTSAAEMAEKARVVGPVSKDILAYLRQTGVPLREQ